MLIAPTATPIASIDQSNVNQTQQNSVQQSVQSKKATDTVQISAKAQELAGTELKKTPEQQSEIFIAKQAENNKVADQQQRINPLTYQPTNNKIDVVT